MSQEDDQRLQHMLKQVEARKRAEAQQAEFERQRIEGDAKRRETAKPKIAHFISSLKSIAASVTDELQPTGVKLKVQTSELPRGTIQAVVTANPPGSGRVVTLEMEITDQGYVSGAGLITNQQGRNSQVEEITADMIRGAYLKIAESVLGLRPFK